MDEMYGRIEKLCEAEGITVGKMCSELGISRGTLGDLKAGRTKKLSADNLSKIAKRFSVPSDFILTGEQKENAPTVTGKSVSDDDIKFALFGKTDIDDAVMEEVKRFAKFAEENSRGGKK